MTKQAYPIRHNFSPKALAEYPHEPRCTSGRPREELLILLHPYLQSRNCFDEDLWKDYENGREATDCRTTDPYITRQSPS